MYSGKNLVPWSVHTALLSFEWIPLPQDNRQCEQQLGKVYTAGSLSMDLSKDEWMHGGLIQSQPH